MKPQHYKCVQFAYPSSPDAKRHGYAKTGCYIVSTGPTPHLECRSTKLEGVHATEAKANEHAERISLEWSPLYRKDYDDAKGIARYWPKDGAWHIGLPCADPDPDTGLKTGGFRFTEAAYPTRAEAIAAIHANA